MIDVVEKLTDINYEKYESVIFDCFGTILNITDKTYPYYYYLKHHGISDKSIYSFIMKNPIKLEDLNFHLNLKEDVSILNHSKKLLQNELKSIKFFKDSIEILTLLKSKKILICSNLAFPYGESLKNIDSLKILSYEVGLIKPEFEIYELCLDKLQSKPQNTVFIGDNHLCDYLTPKKLGINSFLIKRNN